MSVGVRGAARTSCSCSAFWATACRKAPDRIRRTGAGPRLARVHSERSLLAQPGPSLSTHFGRISSTKASPSLDCAPARAASHRRDIPCALRSGRIGSHERASVSWRPRGTRGLGGRACRVCRFGGKREGRLPRAGSGFLTHGAFSPPPGASWRSWSARREPVDDSFLESSGYDA